jgi:2-C-methyl-D-erythritol 4-phosphate cytidylyltransferase
MKITAIIPAAGTGSRYSQNRNKLLENLNGIPVITHTLRAIAANKNVNNIIICTSQDLMDDINNVINEYPLPKPCAVILGGKVRQESVFLALKYLDAQTAKPDYVLIHDAARPLISSNTLENSVNDAKNKGSSVVAVKTKDTIKLVDNTSNKIIKTIDRSALWNIQTPQIFKFNDILTAHNQFKGENFTDDSALLEEYGMDVYITEGDYKNIKITTAEDLVIAQILANQAL